MPAARLRRALLAAAVAALLAPAARAADVVVVFAAASLRTALDAVAADWTEATGNTATISYAASPALAKQIEEGAPADIFFSADLDWMDYLQARGLIDPATRESLLGNEHRADRRGPWRRPDRDRARLRPGRRAGRRAPRDGRRQAVPAGKYGKAALESLGVWESVADRLAQAENVRAALTLVVHWRGAARHRLRDRRGRRGQGDGGGHLPRGDATRRSSTRSPAPPRAATTRRRASSTSSPAAPPRALRGAGLRHHRLTDADAPGTGPPSACRSRSRSGRRSRACPSACWWRWRWPAATSGARDILNGLVHLPLILPPVVTGYLLLLTFGRRGFVGAGAGVRRHRAVVPLDRRGARLRHHGVPADGARDPAAIEAVDPQARGGRRHARRRPGLDLPPR